MTESNFDQTAWWVKELHERLRAYMSHPTDKRDVLMDTLEAYEQFAKLYPDDLPGFTY